jgi:hypothetical protein
LRIAHLQDGMARVSFELTRVSTQSPRERSLVCARLPGYKSEGAEEIGICLLAFHRAVAAIGVP